MVPSSHPHIFCMKSFSDTGSLAHRTPTSDSDSIALAILRYLRQSVSPRLALIILPPICAPAHPRNRHRRALVRCCRARRSRRLVPRQTTATGNGGRAFQDTIKRASKTTARIRSSKKAAKITVSRMVPQSDPVSDALSPRANSIAGGGPWPNVRRDQKYEVEPNYNAEPKLRRAISAKRSKARKVAKTAKRVVARGKPKRTPAKEAAHKETAAPAVETLVDTSEIPEESEPKPPSLI
jgi:hypothetical protein